jgi:hypothetical protein
MQIRKKNQSMRITFADPSKPENIPYVAIDVTVCWAATFTAWGKRSDDPIIHLGGKQYRVVLEEAAA